MKLFIPGPTPLPKDIREALSRQIIGHRTPEFSEMLERVTERLKNILYTENDIFLLTSSGTGAMEAAISNFLSPGDKVLVVVTGAFGDRFAGIAESFGMNVMLHEVEWGSIADPYDIDLILTENPDVSAVLVTHNETSTGVTNDLSKIGSVVESHDTLLIVDAVSSLGVLPVHVDDWNLDVVVTGAQKGWMSPPGISMVSVSGEAWEAYEKSECPRFYFDLGKARDKYESDRQTKWTPAVSTIFALDLATEKMLEEGMEDVFERHARLAALMRRRLSDMGFTLFSDPYVWSDSVTTVLAPEGLDAEEIRDYLREEYDIRVAGGKKQWKGRALRIGHMGWITAERVKYFLDRMEEALSYLRS